jgi:hypothetical protein
VLCYVIWDVLRVSCCLVLVLVFVSLHFVVPSLCCSSSCFYVCCYICVIYLYLYLFKHVLCLFELINKTKERLCMHDTCFSSISKLMSQHLFLKDSYTCFSFISLSKTNLFQAISECIFWKRISDRIIQNKLRSNLGVFLGFWGAWSNMKDLKSNFH